MKALALVLPLLLLAAPATKPAGVERFTLELRAVQFDWPLPADSPTPPVFDQRTTRSIAQAALGPTAKETWSLSTSAQAAAPFACTAVIEGKTHFLKGDFRRGSSGEFLCSIECGVTWSESKDANGPPMINTSTVKGTVLLKLDEPLVLNWCTPSERGAKATGYTLCVRRPAQPISSHESDSSADKINPMPPPIAAPPQM